MPYTKNQDLPPSVRDHLPPRAQDIFRAVFNHALVEYEGEGEEAAFRAAWSAVKRGYQKVGASWVRKSGLS